MEAKPSVLIIAHRGFSSRYPENTLPAIRAALKLGVDMVEIDVHETRDGRIVVFHDYRLNRLCGVPGRVRDKTLRELPGIPTLEQVLKTCRGRARVLIEIKRADPAKVAGVIERLGMRRQVIVFSMSERIMRELPAGIPRFGLATRNLKFDAPVTGLGVNRRLIRSRADVRRLHRRGLQVFVWTVNRRKEMERLMAWGVDGLITNYPDRAISCKLLTAT